ncbi:rod shape-determining protein MreC [Acetobacteraceae bacterium KSS8]|uniref:Cell shape-determining protein MreC n=1 Tax=Endosaccharibacter trunci TaxID=2812733 RepID=A0ABT1W6S9_9PROT|nr:rod shape-determining protein MreC [Acetobacteraceae bacterium KSS8]
MFSLSIQLRQALGKLTLPLLLALACLVMLVGQADRRLAESARTGVADLLAPFYSFLAQPIDRVRAIGREAHSLIGVAEENERLRAENQRLRRWYDVAMALAAENATLKSNLNWMPEPAPSFVTARAVADASGVYARSVLLFVPEGQTLTKGMVALDAAGLVGRITEVGSRSARVMLINDMTSHVPVMLEASHAPAIVAGDNSAAPRLMDYPEDVRPVEGERVVTSGAANAFPAGLPVGTVHYLPSGQPVLEPYARLDHVGILRLFDYGLSAITPPEAPGRVILRNHADEGEFGTVPGRPAQIGRG